MDIVYPCVASLKRDGELDFIIVTEGNAIIVNKPVYGRIRQDFPVTEVAKGLPDGIYTCELYWDQGKTIADFHKFLSKKTSDNLNCAIWGCIQYKNETRISTKRNFEIMEEIRGIVKEPVIINPYWYIKNREELLALEKRILGEGWEGLVVRLMSAIYVDGLSRSWIKLKLASRDLEAKKMAEIPVKEFFTKFVYYLGRELTDKEKQECFKATINGAFRIDNFKLGMTANKTFLVVKLQ